MAALGNRGPRRYSLGGASQTRHLMHVPPWPRLLDAEAIHAVLAEVYGSDGYAAAGGGGDFVLPFTDLYQSLHTDLGLGLHTHHRAPAIAVSVLWAIAFQT